MSRNVAYVVDAGILARDAIFRNANHELIGDNLYLPDVRLAQSLRAEGIELHTSDTMPLDRFDAFVFLEMPPEGHSVLRFAREHGKPCILKIAENKYIETRNQRYDRYGEFASVLSYEDEAVARFGCAKLNYAFDFSLSSPSEMAFNDRKFAVMISSRVRRNRPHLKSYLRLQTICYYERHHPDQLDLYGRFWEEGRTLFQEHERLFAALAACGLHHVLPNVRCSVWRGPCERKHDLLGEYRFAYCYENTDEILGYITEKIFDVLMAGTVPVYLNHPGSDRYIPREAYISRADFASDGELYDYLATMPESRWLEYRRAGAAFLAEGAADFSIDRYVKTVSDVILKVLA